MRRVKAVQILVCALVLSGSALGLWPKLRAAHACCAGTARASDRDQAQVMEPCCCDHDCATHPGCGCVQSGPKRATDATPAPLPLRTTTLGHAALTAVGTLAPPPTRTGAIGLAAQRPPDIPTAIPTRLRC